MNKKSYILELCSTEVGRRILIDRIDEVLKEKDLYKYDCMEEITRALLKSDKGKEIIEKRFKEIVGLFDFDWYNDAGENEPEDIKFWNFIQELLKDRKEYELVIKNLYLVMHKMGNLETVDFIEQLEQKDSSNIHKKNSFLYGMYEKSIMYKDTLGIMIKNDLNDFCEVLFDELSEGKEITTLGEGGYSQVFKTNGYIVKIGKQRERYETPYHPNILQPLMKIRGVDEKGNYRYVIEVQDECDVQNVTEEDALKLKKILKEMGIIWSDEAKENIGITLKPNKRILNIGTIEKPDKFNGSYDVGISDKEISKGAVVITDVDCINYWPQKEKSAEEIDIDGL